MLVNREKVRVGLKVNYYITLLVYVFFEFESVLVLSTIVPVSMFSV